MELYLFLFAAGSGVGFLSGLMGIGGGIVMFPLLLYAPPLLGTGEIGVKSATGLTMAQGFFASLSAMLFYRKHKLVNVRLVVSLGLSLFVSSLAGALVSRWTPDGPILFVFGALALSASLLMLSPRSYARDELTEEKVTFNRTLSVSIGLALGFFLGLLGQGGAFIIIPVLLYILKVPLRVALGSTLAIGLFSSTAGLLGKALTGQVRFDLALAMLAGAVPFARVGGAVGRKASPVFLKWLLALLISASAIKIWHDIFFS